MADQRIQVLITLKDQASKGLRQFGSSVSRLKIGDQFKSIHTNALIATAGITAAGLALAAMSETAGKIESVRDAFQSMTKSWGYSADEIVAATQKASRGTLSQADIMKNGLKAMSLIGQEALGDLTEMFPRLAEIAKKAARVTGQDVSFMLESITTGIGRTSTKWLDNTGIVVNATEAYKKYAEQLGITTDDLSESQKKTALLNEWLGKAEETYKDVAVSSGGYSSAIQGLRASFSDLIYGEGGIAEAVVPEFTDLLKNVITPYVKEKGPQTVEITKEIVKWFKSWPGWLTKTTVAMGGLLFAITALGIVLIPVVAAFRVFKGIALLLWGALGLGAVQIGLLVAALAILTYFAIRVSIPAWQQWKDWFTTNMPIILEGISNFVRDAIIALADFDRETGAKLEAAKAHFILNLETINQVGEEKLLEFRIMVRDSLSLSLNEWAYFFGLVLSTFFTWADEYKAAWTQYSEEYTKGLVAHLEQSWRAYEQSWVWWGETATEGIANLKEMITTWWGESIEETRQRSAFMQGQYSHLWSRTQEIWSEGASQAMIILRGLGIEIMEEFRQWNVSWTEAWATLTGVIVSSLTNLRISMKSKFEEMRGDWNEFWENLKVTGKGAFESFFGGFSVGMRQFGGFVQSGQPYMVGERGPELFVPSTPGRIEPRAAPARAGGTFNANVYIGLYAGSELEKRKVAEALMEEFKFLARAKGRSIIEEIEGGP